jgi:ketosteroid isomerase-like protein
MTPRDLIAKWDAAPRGPSGTARQFESKDRVLFSGAHKQPVIGDTPPSLADPTEMANRASKTTKTTPVRIEVAKSGDLAYEFSNSDIIIVTKDGKKESFPTSLLRVWEKESGEWKIAAHFVRSHEQ